MESETREKRVVEGFATVVICKMHVLFMPFKVECMYVCMLYLFDLCGLQLGYLQLSPTAEYKSISFFLLDSCILSVEYI